MYLATADYILLCTLFITFVSGDPATNYYRELDCESVKENGGKPSKYNCSFLDEIKQDKCFYSGKEYNIDETIKDEQVNDKCIVECTCIKIYETNKARWSCVDIECPELFQYEPKCKYLFNSHNECCSPKKVCNGEKVEGTCEYGGKTYMYGEKFYPTEEKCKRCICGEGFNGSLTEPWCRTFSCNLYLHYLNYIREGCLPAYFETDSCCPIPVWRCPKDGDTVVTPKTVDLTESSKDNVCKFGKLSLVVGQMLSPSKEAGSESVECSCQVPPHLTCIMKSNH